MFKLTPFAIAALMMVAPAHASDAPAAPASTQQATLAASIDALLGARYKADAPGAAVIVVKDGQTVLRKGYGLADVETRTPMSPDMVLRIGSLTKQFTAVAIMMLAEQGKLSVTDPLTRFFPDYPNGDRITVEHLLTHTSGIPSYTGKADFMMLAASTPSVSQVIDSFKNDPLEFAPGSTYRYNNSGYFLLGAIIEKLSGKPYADFMAEQVFKPLGMQHTAYDGHERVKAARARGHSVKDGKAGINDALFMGLPYAAGALVSTVDDLARWNAAIQAGKLLKPATWARMFTPYTLSSGEKITYAYGWDVGTLQGTRRIEHDGAINGYRSHAISLPQENVFVAVLHNADSGPGHPVAAGRRVAALAIGKPLIDYKSIKVEEKAVEAVSGLYQQGKARRSFFNHHGVLVMHEEGGQVLNLQPFKANGFYLPGQQFQVEFEAGADGKPARAIVTEDGSATTFTRVGEAVKPQVANITAAEFDKLVGRYPLAPGFVLTISREGERFFAQGTGQPPLEVFAQSSTVFRARDVAAELHFGQDDKGQPMLTLLQNGQKISASRAATPVAAIQPAEFDKLVGRYPLHPDFVLTVSRQGERYFVQATGQPPFEIFAHSANVFRVPDVEAELHFSQNDKGQQVITLVQNGVKQSGTRVQ